MGVCESNELDCVWGGEGDIGVCVCFGALSVYKVSGASLAWHWHFVCVHVHLKRHSLIVWSCG